MTVCDLGRLGVAFGLLATTALADGAWTTLPSPNPSPSSNQLYGVGGTGPSDVWAVGTYVDPEDGFLTLALHWDGAQWTHVPTPTPSSGDLIRAVAAIAPDDVWAVGGHGIPYVFHFDGSAWSAAVLPQPGQWGFGIAVFDVVALAADDVWAVGWYDHTGAAGLRTAVWHWNGASWSVVPSPSVPNTSGGAYPSMLLSISAAGPNALFAVGEWRIGATWFPLALRYDGMSWQLQSTPVSATGDGRLRAVSARAPNDVWAVGTADDDAGVIGGGWAQAFAMHFDGNAWSVVPTPQPSPWGSHSLRGVFARAGDVYAVGAWENATQGLDTFILRLDQDAGTGFTVVPSTNIPGDGEGWNELYDIALVGDHLWALGFGQAAFSAPHQTLVARAQLELEAEPFCFGDGSAAACPCGNGGATGHGCENSASTGGALLTATGEPSLSADSVVLTSSAERATSFSLFLQGDAELSPPVLFGDGLRCTGGNLKRLYARNAVAGTATAPTGAGPSITARSAALGDTIPAFGTRFYQVYYRDPSPSFCPNPPGSTFNVSNGVAITWGP